MLFSDPKLLHISPNVKAKIGFFFNNQAFERKYEVFHLICKKMPNKHFLAKNTFQSRNCIGLFQLQGKTELCWHLSIYDKTFLNQLNRCINKYQIHHVMYTHGKVENQVTIKLTLKALKQVLSGGPRIQSFVILLT